MKEIIYLWSPFIDMNSLLCKQEYTSTENTQFHLRSLLANFLFLGLYKPLVRLTTNLLTTLTWCVFFSYISMKIYDLNSAPNDRFKRIFLRQFFLLSEFLPEIFWKIIAEVIFSTYFVLFEASDLNCLSDFEL